MLQLESPVLTSEKLLLNVLNLTICIKSKVEGKDNMDGLLGKYWLFIPVLFSESIIFASR